MIEILKFTFISVFDMVLVNLKIYVVIKTTISMNVSLIVLVYKGIKFTELYILPVGGKFQSKSKYQESYITKIKQAKKCRK